MSAIRLGALVAVWVGLVPPGTKAGEVPGLRVDNGGAVTALAFSADGGALACAGEDRVIRLADRQRGELVRRFEGHEGRIGALAYSPDGRWLASGSRDATVRVWDPATGRARLVCKGHDQTVLGLSFSPDGRHLASGSYDGTIRIWELKEGRCVCRIEAHGDAVSGVSFADNQTLATGSHDRLVRVWEFDEVKRTSRLRNAFGGRRQEVVGLAYCLDGRVLASLQPGNDVVLRSRGGDELRLFMGDNPRTLTLAASADGRTLAVAGFDGELAVYEAASGKQVLRAQVPAPGTRVGPYNPLAGWPATIRALALSPNGLALAAGSSDGKTFVLDLGEALAGGPPGKGEVAKPEALWDELASDDPAVGYRAAGWLAVRPAQAVALFARRLRSAAEPDPARLARLVTDLGSERFADRDRAEKELARHLEAAAPLLRRALAARPPLDQTRRIERLLRPLEESFPSADQLRRARAVQVLEQLRSAEALALLAELARGDPDSVLARQAAAVLVRQR